MDNEFLANIQQEGRIDTPAEQEIKEKETPPESPAETKPEDKPASPAEDKEKGETPEPKEGEPEVFHAFHEHPRWIATQNELKELREFREQAAPLLERLAETPEKQEKSESIPGWFSTLFGTDENAWSQYRQYSQEERQRIKEEVISEVRKEEETRIADSKKWESWVDSEVKRLSDEGKKFDKNELLKIAVEYKPSDDQGNISFDKAYQILEQTKKPAPALKADDKKKVADQTISKGVASEDRKDYKTSADFIGKTFADISRE